MSAKKKLKALPSLSAEQRTEAKQWLDERRGEIPQVVSAAIELCIVLAEQLADVQRGRASIVRRLRLAMGIIPSSEKSKNCKDPLAGVPDKGAKAKMTLAERLAYEAHRSKRLADWYRKLIRRHVRKARESEAKLMEITSVEDIALSPEEEIELEKAGAEYELRCALGARCDLDAAMPSEKLMTGAATHAVFAKAECEVDRDSLPKEASIIQRFTEERERISFSFSVTNLTLNVEKLSVATKDGIKLVAASVEDFGPPKSRVTWEFLSSMTIMVSQYAMPMNRFAALASTSEKKFTTSEISRHFQYVAGRLCSVYLALARGLANAAILCGDDTNSRVIELNKALTLQGSDPRAVMPWADYKTSEIAAKTLKDRTVTPTLALRLAEQLGFESSRKDGTGPKRDFNTSVIGGRTNAYDPRTTIVFYRSHLGGLGNLLTTILGWREADHRDLVIQTDLSTVNLISDPKILDKFNVSLAGCFSHARRPFEQYEHDDPDLCSWILHLFKGLSIYEYGIDTHGRNAENTEAVRSLDVKETWESIREVATKIAHKWSRETVLGEGARYIIKHYEKLTYYLRDHRVGPSNNFSERMLRMERLIENNALFRQTLEGRCALDIVRTVLQTAVAANTNLSLYLNWLLRMPAEAVDATPEEFTPHAFAMLNAATI